MPPGRFIYSSSFTDLDSALRSGPGWLDLFSGTRGLGKCLAAVTPCWILCLDLQHGADEDLRSERLQDLLDWLLLQGAFYGFSAGPACGSFSSATGFSYRSKDYPRGLPGLPIAKREKVEADNELLSFLLRLVETAETAGLIFLIENPRNSWLWKQEAWSGLLSEPGCPDFLCDMCAFGTRWKKATRVRTNCSLRGQRLLCKCSVPHQVLRGRDKRSGVTWTKLAESYPRKFSMLLAHSIAGDIGRLGEYRPLDIARCAKCSSARIGEASKPGPRRARAARPALRLKDLQLVEPATALLRARVWGKFRAWLEQGAGPDSWESTLQVPSLLVQMLIAYGQVLYDENASLNDFRQLLAHAQAVLPAAKALMRPA